MQVNCCVALTHNPHRFCYHSHCISSMVSKHPINLQHALWVLQAGAGHSLSGIQRWSVWFMSLISAGIAVASVVVNDYFDLKLDSTNAPDKPLPSGNTFPQVLVTAVVSRCALGVATAKPSIYLHFCCCGVTQVPSPLMQRCCCPPSSTAAASLLHASWSPVGCAASWPSQQQLPCCTRPCSRS
jgi:hypothetical protein